MGHELHIQLFMAFCLFGWGLALSLGGWTERCAALIVMSGLLVSLIAISPLRGRFAHPEWGLIAVDATMLIAFAALLVRYKRSWLVWMTGFQLLIVLSHFPILLVPLITPEGYILTNALWPWLMMIVLIGTTIQRIWQRRRRATGNS